MLNLKSRVDKIDVLHDEVETITVVGRNFAIIDFSGFCYHSGGLALLEEFIAKNGGIVRKSVVKNTDYVIICPVAYKSTGNYKKPADEYEKAIALKNNGKPISFISDLDFFVHFKLFSKLRVDNKLRVADAFLNDCTSFDEKEKQKIEKFINDQKNTFKYKEYFDQAMDDYTKPIYDR